MSAVWRLLGAAEIELLNGAETTAVSHGLARDIAAAFHT
jgi:hypothetical protein